jgi:transposase-like protein
VLSSGYRCSLTYRTEQNRTEVKKIYLSFMLIKIKGFFDAINAAYSNAKIQLCIVHMIRNSLKFFLEGLQGNDD